MHSTLKAKAREKTPDVYFDGLFYEVKTAFFNLPHNGRLLFRDKETADYFNSYFNSTAKNTGYKSSKTGNILQKISLFELEKQKEAEGMVPDYPFIVLP